ncbi:MAG: type II secretion system protein GspF [Candidatus Binatia bacterium]|nr:MAG: type II secretion system protein GspF [Candidatus Binatia bacterium]
MPVYAYKGLNTAGRAVSGIIDADSPKGARLKLRRSGVYPTELQEERAAARPGTTARVAGFSLERYFERVGPYDLSLMTRQLSTLVGAGLPLVDCLGALVEQTENARLKRVLSQVREHVVEGGALADGMAKHPRIFSSLYVNMVRAGEASGALDVVLERLADYTEATARLRNRVRSALTYPVLMGTVSIAIVFFLVSYVVPRVVRIFEDTKQALPWATVVLIRVSTFCQQYWWLLLAALVFSAVAFRIWVRTPQGRMTFDTYVLRVPYFGGLLKKVALARFARTLSTLLRSGIPLLTSLDIVRNVVANVRLADAIDQARESIREGHSIAPPLQRSGLFPPLLVHMIAVGERSGELEEMLARAADSYDNEVETSIASLTSIMEPVIILVMGAVVLFIVLAILVPIFELNQLVR